MSFNLDLISVKICMETSGFGNPIAQKSISYRLYNSSPVIFTTAKHGTSKSPFQDTLLKDISLWILTSHRFITKKTHTTVQPYKLKDELKTIPVITCLYKCRSEPIKYIFKYMYIYFYKSEHMLHNINY